MDCGRCTAAAEIHAGSLSALDKQKPDRSSVLAVASGPVNIQLLGVLAVSVT
jgi:hypothetical protein